jgi:UDP-glucose 4-epimerase
MDELKQGKKRIIVTGGAGLIGKPICDLLIENGHIVWSFDNYSNSTNDVHHKDCNVVEIDICQREKVIEKVLEIKPDLIYHLACHPYEGLSQFCPYRVCDTTLMATINMVTAAVKSHSVKRFINFSSMARYGKGHLGDNGTIERPPYKERYRPNPEDVYASAKVSAEECVKMLCDLHGIEWCTVIPHNHRCDLILSGISSFPHQQCILFSFFLQFLLQFSNLITIGGLLGFLSRFVCVK